MKKTVFIAIMMLLMSQPVFAEVVILESGDKIEANVIKRDDKVVVIDYKGITISYYNFEVKSIDGEPVSTAKKDAAKDVKKSPEEIVSLPVITAEEYLRRGMAYYDRGNFIQAVSDYNKALRVKPDYPEVYLYRGQAYANMKEPEKAFQDYSKAIEMDPKFEEAYYVRGLTYAAQGKLENALADYSKAIEINAQYIQAYLNRGYVYINKNNPGDAIADFNKIIKINPSIPAVYYLRGVAYANKGNLQQAIADYTKAIELEPKYLEAYTNRALAYIFKGSFEQSKVDPNSPRAFINIGPTYNNKADLERALKDCAKVIELNPKFAEGYIVRARVYIAQSDYDLAWQDIHKAEELGAQPNPQIIEELKQLSGREK